MAAVGVAHSAVWQLWPCLRALRALELRLHPGPPCPQVNLQTGVPPDSNNETCTAGAGSLLVEFGILSRLLGDSTFEWVARRAVKALWSLRSNDTGLLGAEHLPQPWGPQPGAPVLSSSLGRPVLPTPPFPASGSEARQGGPQRGPAQLLPATSAWGQVVRFDGPRRLLQGPF